MAQTGVEVGVGVGVWVGEGVGGNGLSGKFILHAGMPRKIVPAKRIKTGKSRLFIVITPQITLLTDYTTGI